MNSNFFIVIFLALAISGCSGQISVDTDRPPLSKIQTSAPASQFSPDRVAGTYHLGNGSERKNLNLNLRDDSTFSCQWFDYGSRGCAGSEIRGECSGSWQAEGNLIKITNEERSGYFADQPLGNLAVEMNGFVQTLVQTNDREEHDRRPSDETCFRKNDPNMVRYPQTDQWPNELTDLIGNDRQLVGDVKPLGVNPSDDRFIFETYTRSKLRQKILDAYELETVSPTHPLVTMLVHSIPDSRLRWEWDLEPCNLLASTGLDNTEDESETSIVIVDHPDSNETIVFIQRN